MALPAIYSTMFNLSSATFYLTSCRELSAPIIRQQRPLPEPPQACRCGR